MARSYAHEYLHHWYNALDEEIGIELRVPDAENRKKLSDCLYEARKEVGDPELDEIMILQIAPDTLFLAKRSTEVE